MSNIPMNNLNIQRRVLNPMHNQSMPMLSNHCFVPLPPNQNQERNPESKINLAFGLLRKNTARTNGIWKIIQSLINRVKRVEEMAARIDQVIKRNEELEDKRRKNNKKRNEKKRIKREKRQKEKEMRRKRNEPEEKDIRNKEDENKSEEKKQINLGPKYKKKEQNKKEEEEEVEKSKDSRIPKNDLLEISRTKFDSRKNKNDSMNNLEISRTNLINKKLINKKFINEKKIINNKDEISFGGNQLRDNSYDDECSLQLNDKINQGNEKLSNNGRNKQNVINLVNRFIINNKNIYSSNQKWVCHTFIPLIEDIMDLNLYDIDVSDYVRKVKSPPDFRKKFWQWWQKKDEQKKMLEILKITQKLKQSKDPDIMKLLNCN